MAYEKVVSKVAMKADVLAGCLDKYLADLWVLEGVVSKGEKLVAERDDGTEA